MDTKTIKKTSPKYELQRGLSYLSLLADLLVADTYKPATTERKKRIYDNLKEMTYRSQRCLQMIEKNTNQ